MLEGRRTAGQATHHSITTHCAGHATLHKRLHRHCCSTAAHRLTITASQSTLLLQLAHSLRYQQYALQAYCQVSSSSSRSHSTGTAGAQQQLMTQQGPASGLIWFADVQGSTIQRYL